MNLKTWLKDNFNNALIVDMVSESTNTFLQHFHSSGYDEVTDTILKAKLGKQIILQEYEEDPEDGAEAVYAILMERARWIEQNLEYLESEYNPIDNYDQREHEEITFDGGARSGGETYGYAQYSDTRNVGQRHVQTVKGAQTDTYDPNGITITTTGDKQTTTNSVSPDDTNTFFNKEKTTVEGTGTGGKIESVQKTTADNPAQTVSGARTDQVTENAYTDSMQHGAHEDTVSKSAQAYTDETVRDLTRAGNIGIRTSSEIMMLDERWWWSNKWLSKLAREIACILCEGVECV